MALNSTGLPPADADGDLNPMGFRPLKFLRMCGSEQPSTRAASDAQSAEVVTSGASPARFSASIHSIFEVNTVRTMHLLPDFGLASLAALRTASQTFMSLASLTVTPWLSSPKGQACGRIVQALVGIQVHTVLLNFKHAEMLSDLEFGALVAQIPRQTKTLTRDFTWNRSLSNAALLELAERLPPGLRRLALLFRSNEQFTDQGLQGLASKIPTPIKALRYEFTYNTKFTDLGLIALAEWIPEGVASLVFAFEWNKRLTDTSLRSLVAHIPQTLRVLDLQLEESRQVTDEGLAALGSHLPDKLIRLTLNFGQGSRFTYEGLRGLTARLPRQLRVLELNFSSNIFPLHAKQRLMSSSSHASLLRKFSFSDANHSFESLEPSFGSESLVIGATGGHFPAHFELQSLRQL